MKKPKRSKPQPLPEDPRQPLPEAVNAQFQSGEVRRIRVSSPWMPPVCQHCKEIGHSIKHCRAAPILCSICSSRTHQPESCPKATQKDPKKSESRRSRARSREGVPPPPVATLDSYTATIIKFSDSTLTKEKLIEKEQCSGSNDNPSKAEEDKRATSDSDIKSVEIITDSSDVDTDEADLERSRTEKAVAFTKPLHLVEQEPAKSGGKEA
ncbi:hypothetical protein YC2023_025263 [Brassica napus]